MQLRSSTFTYVFAAAVAAAWLWSCGNPSTSGPSTSTGENPATPAQFPGATETDQNLTALATPCAFVPDSGVVTIVMAAGEYALLGGTTDGGFRVNGVACGTAVLSTVKNVTVTGSTGDETVIIDYLPGAFAMGNASSVGIAIDLKAGTGDTVKLRGSAAADTVLLGTSVLDAGVTGTMAVGLGLNGAAPVANVKNITFTGVENFVVSTGPGDDVVKTNGQADAGYAFPAFGKTTTGTGPTLTFYGGDNNDTLDLGAAKGGAVTFYGGANTDTADFSGRTAAITCTIGAASCGESSEGDLLQTDVEVLSGGAGNDTLACDSATACTLNGNAGNDVLTGSHDSDTINGGLGTDTLSYAAWTYGVTVNLPQVGATSSGNGSGSDGGVADNDTIGGIENVIGSTVADTIQGNDQDNVITGGAGNDTLKGGEGSDTFVMADTKGNCGNDTIDGEGGVDTVDYHLRSAAVTVVLTAAVASTGNGDQTATAENDSLVNVENVLGGAGNDTITGDANANYLEGGAGDDTISSGLGADVIDPGTSAGASPGDDVTCGSYQAICVPAPAGSTLTTHACF